MYNPSGLLGSLKYEDNDLRAPSRWRASSWTWAALDGAVRLGSYFEEDLDIAVISGSTDLKGGDQYEEVSSGVVTLRGEVAQANCDFIDWERSSRESSQESELVAELEPVPDYLLEPLSDHPLEWETVMPHGLMLERVSGDEPQYSFLVLGPDVKDLVSSCAANTCTRLIAVPVSNSKNHFQMARRATYKIQSTATSENFPFMPSRDSYPSMRPLNLSYRASCPMQNQLHVTREMLPGCTRHTPFELFINQSTGLPVSPQAIYVVFGDEK